MRETQEAAGVHLKWDARNGNRANALTSWRTTERVRLFVHRRAAAFLHLREVVDVKLAPAPMKLAQFARLSKAATAWQRQRQLAKRLHHSSRTVPFTSAKLTVA